MTGQNRHACIYCRRDVKDAWQYPPPDNFEEFVARYTLSSEVFVLFDDICEECKEEKGVFTYREEERVSCGHPNSS